MPQRHISASEEITSYMHCRSCLPELPVDESPATWARLNVGFTPIGVQVWCIRCKCNVVHIDFEGQRHPAQMNRLSS